MTTCRETTTICCVCGNNVAHPVLLSTNSLGSPDLDLRQAGMARNTMSLWVTSCPSCGYVNYDISKADLGEKKLLSIINSKSYKTCDNLELPNDLAKKFYKQYLLDKATKDNRFTFSSLRNCAWVCDDCEAKEMAKKIRLLAIPYLEEIVKDLGKKDDKLMLADYYRRTEQFDRTINYLSNLKFSEERLTQVANYEIYLAKQKDCKCHTVDEAVAYSKLKQI